MKGETNELCFFSLPGRVVKPRWKRYQSRTMLIEFFKKKKTGLDLGKRWRSFKTDPWSVSPCPIAHAQLMHISIYLNRPAPSCKQVFTENKNVKRSLLFLVQQRRSVWFWKQETPICLESAQHATKLFIWVRNWWANTLWSALVTSWLWQPLIEGLFLSTVADIFLGNFYIRSIRNTENLARSLLF